MYVFAADGAGGYQETKLTAPDAAFGDEFGEAVAIRGDTNVVGSPSDDDNGDWSGSVYVYTVDGSGNHKATKLAASDGDADDQFGSSVAVSARRIVVGAPGADDLAGHSGAAYVFSGIRSQAYRESRLTTFDGASSSGFGLSVAVAGRTIVVGAPFDSDAGPWSGAAYVFRTTSGGYSNKKLTASDATWGQDFGEAVATTGTKVVVGAPLNDLAVPLQSGAAYLFAP